MANVPAASLRSQQPPFRREVTKERPVFAGNCSQKDALQPGNATR